MFRTSLKFCRGLAFPDRPTSPPKAQLSPVAVAMRGSIKHPMTSAALQESHAPQLGKKPAAKAKKQLSKDTVSDSESEEVAANSSSEGEDEDEDEEEERDAE